MNRRGFLGVLAAGAAVAADPERALWRPGARLISIAAPMYSVRVAYRFDGLAVAVDVFKGREVPADRCYIEHGSCEHGVSLARAMDVAEMAAGGVRSPEAGRAVRRWLWMGPQRPDDPVFSYWRSGRPGDRTVVMGRAV